ncbi:MAG: PLP-dependent aminotransferase family protein [Gemmatimonadetes bacterium]|nr:PLP-dependent aminotransferase family protein [Gemmatimonadota bacterium]
MKGERASAEPFAYERLAADITSRVTAGTLRPGDRLPSVRQMSTQRGLSIPTVLHAYRLLEAGRVIAARARSGFYVLSRTRSALPEPAGPAAVRDPAEIATADLIMRSLEIVSGPGLIPLGTALPDPDLLPSVTLALNMVREARRRKRDGPRFPTPSGTPELRSEISRRSWKLGITAEPDDVVVTCGCTEAVTLCLRALTRPGDVVAVESPAYFGTLQALDVLRLRALEIPVDPLAGICLSTLSAALDRGGVAAVVVTPNVHNPLGCIMSDARKRELADLLSTHQVPAIEDDTYGDLHFGHARPPSLQAFDPAGLVLSCGSFSKTLAPDHRVGWTIPGRYREQVLHAKLATTAASPVPAQLAIAEYLASGAYDTHLRRLRRVFQANVDRLTVELAERFPEDTRISRPDGGFLLWVQLPDGIHTPHLQRRALSHGVSVAPGPAFSASGEFGNYLRISAAYTWSERIGYALDTLAMLIDECRRKG